MGTAERIKDIMTTGVISIPETEKVAKAVTLMAERNISCVIITAADDKSRPVGIVTERDLVRRVLQQGADPKKITASEIMTKNLVTISEDASLEEGMRIIESMRIRRLPVVGKNGLKGLITQSDIVKETYNIHQHNLKLTFHQNIQSYVIIALALVMVVAFLVRFILAS